MKIARAVKGFLLSFVFLAFFAYMISGVQWSFNNLVANPDGADFIADVSARVYSSLPEIKTIESPEINAQAAISIESNLQTPGKIVFAKNSAEKLPIASLTKLMTAIVVLDNYKLSDFITVDETADLQDPMKQDVKLGDTMSVESFFQIMLIESSNKAAYALSDLMGEEKFVAIMNNKAQDLGLKNTFFADPTGLSPRNISTAADLAKLAEYILKIYPKIAEISCAKEFDVKGFGRVANTDQLLAEIPEAVCSKTGFTEAAKGCLLLVVSNEKNGNYLINVVLGADDRFSEMKKIYDYNNRY